MILPGSHYLRVAVLERLVSPGSVRPARALIVVHRPQARLEARTCGFRSAATANACRPYLGSQSPYRPRLAPNRATPNLWLASPSEVAAKLARQITEVTRVPDRRRKCHLRNWSCTGCRSGCR